MSKLVLRGVSRTFGGYTAVDNLNLTLHEGELVSLLGSSGCGKTTTLRMIAGFITPTTGTIELDGEVISSPQSSLPPLLALEAARLQSRCAQQALALRLREAAFLFGVNVARRDVLLELAAATGLQMDRFAVALDAPATLRAVEQSRLQAIRHGVRAVPAVVVGREWPMSGVRELHEYRDVLMRWWDRRGESISPWALN